MAHFCSYFLVKILHLNDRNKRLYDPVYHSFTPGSEAHFTSRTPSGCLLTGIAIYNLKNSSSVLWNRKGIHLKHTNSGSLKNFAKKSPSPLNPELLFSQATDDVFTPRAPNIHDDCLADLSVYISENMPISQILS